MSTYFSGLITSDMKSLYNDAIDEIIRALGCTCTVVYKGAKWIECPNCLINVQTGKSSGQYKSGGPISFNTGICPYCKGIGQITTESSESLILAVIWDSRKFLGTRIQTGEQYIQTICRLQYYDELKKASHLIVDTDIIDYSRNIFQRDGEPYFGGFDAHDYVFVIWKRI